MEARFKVGECIWQHGPSNLPRPIIRVFVVILEDVPEEHLEGMKCEILYSTVEKSGYIAGLQQEQWFLDQGWKIRRLPSVETARVLYGT